MRGAGRHPQTLNAVALPLPSHPCGSRSAGGEWRCKRLLLPSADRFALWERQPFPQERIGRRTCHVPSEAAVTRHVRLNGPPKREPVCRTSLAGAPQGSCHRVCGSRRPPKAASRWHAPCWSPPAAAGPAAPRARSARGASEAAAPHSPLRLRGRSRSLPRSASARPRGPPARSLLGRRCGPASRAAPPRKGPRGPPPAPPANRIEAKQPRRWVWWEAGLATQSRPDYDRVTPSWSSRGCLGVV
jgi:hypothetical protein